MGELVFDGSWLEDEKYNIIKKTDEIKAKQYYCNIGDIAIWEDQD